VWIEGIPLRLTRHAAAFVPPGLLHNAENTRVEDLLIVGITAPGVVPGSYSEVPPILRPTGRLASAQALTCSVVVESSDPTGGQVARMDPPPSSFRLVVRRVTAGIGAVTRTSSTTRIWVGVGGRGTVTFGRGDVRPMTGFATVVASPGAAVTFRGGRRAMRLLELSLPS
jgi:mannose-6-phosphate isomerase-like protein (cupin superfamily)